MASNSIIEVRIGAPENVLEVEVGTVEVDVPRSVGYYGGLAVAVGIGLIACMRLKSRDRAFDCSRRLRLSRSTRARGYRTGRLRYAGRAVAQATR